MSKKKKGTNGAAKAAVTGDVIGREQRIVRRDLDDEDVEVMRGKMRRTYAAQREAQSAFTGFAKWAEPRVRAALDPDYKNDAVEDEEPLDEGAARALHDEIEHRRRLKSSTVNAIKAERRLLMDAIANGYEHRVIECERRANVERLQVEVIDPTTSEVIDCRAMTAAERQMALPTESSGAPDAVM